jgi:hypothetical protein
MAVLVGVLAPQYMKYLDKSKKGVDEQLCDNVRQAMTTCYLDPNVSNKPTATGNTKTDLGSGSGFWDEVYGILGSYSLKLDNTQKIQYTLINDKFCVYVEGGKYSGSLKIAIE